MFGAYNRWGYHSYRGACGPMQARRGDMKPMILSVLAEKPMHGYEIIRHLEEKNHGMWRPSPGSVYPTLQLLEDEDLVVSLEDNGKKVYTLTEQGKKEAAQSSTQGPWEAFNKEHFEKMKETEIIGSKITQTLREIVASGDKQKQKQALELLDKTEATIRKILEKGRPAD